MFKSIMTLIIFLPTICFASVCTESTIRSRLQKSPMVQGVVDLYAKNHKVECHLAFINTIGEMESDGEPNSGFVAMYYCPRTDAMGYRTIAVEANCDNGDLSDKPVDPVSISFDFAL
ncbi:MAG: hypothetical protein KDD38_04490 [Bdellovibrionales bacterium]|nr:hypothetical protein [Bdellovibrionales bacterium]